MSGSGDTPAIALRIYLRQPAVHWKAITLKQIQVLREGRGGGGLREGERESQRQREGGGGGITPKQR